MCSITGIDSWSSWSVACINFPYTTLYLHFYRGSRPTDEEPAALRALNKNLITRLVDLDAVAPYPITADELLGAYGSTTLRINHGLVTSQGGIVDLSS